MKYVYGIWSALCLLALVAIGIIRDAGDGPAPDEVAQAAAFASVGLLLIWVVGLGLIALVRYMLRRARSNGGDP